MPVLANCLIEMSEMLIGKRKVRVNTSGIDRCKNWILGVDLQGAFQIRFSNRCFGETDEGLAQLDKIA